MKRQELFRKMMIAVLLALLLALSGCSSGSDGSAGATGATGPAGPAGPTSTNPSAYTVYSRTNVSTQGGVQAKHGGGLAADYLAEEGPLATVAITGATANVAGLATVTFTVKNAAGAAVTGIGAANSASFFISSLQPKGGDLSYNKWINYIWQASGGVNRAYRERNSAAGGANPLVEGPAGTYTYTFAQNLAAATYPVGGAAIIYDRTRTHRVMVALRFSGAGYHGGTTYDFRPDGLAITEKRNIVEDATCQKCHKDTPGHYGPWNGIANACVSCHIPGSSLVNPSVAAGSDGKTNTIEASVMLHKIHAGRELASAPGPDGIFFDDPSLPMPNYSKDNGTYNLGGLSSTWRSAAFPAVLDNCVACHTEKTAGTLAQVDNWKTVPSRAACGSCHDLINWTTGANHAGGLATNDNSCAVCHPATGAGFGKSVTEAHNFTAKDIRNIPEFDVSVTTDTPARGYYIKGESPVITIVLKKGGTAIDHTTVVEQTAAAEGCITNADKSACTNAADGLFRAANMYVTGPRAKPIPVLTTAARAKITSATAGPWDLSAGGAALRLVVDSGNFIVEFGHIGEDVLVPGDFTVTLPAAGAALNALFANPAAATAAEIVAWLNGTKAAVVYNERDFLFSDRAIAYVEGGKVSIRTRALGSDNPSIQIPARFSSTSKDALNELLFTDNAVKVAGSAAQVRKRASAANDDPKAVRTAANIKYTLDPVDDLTAGTYMINVEFGDRGNNTGNVAGSYKTPSIAVATFQVKQAATEKPMADGCTSCHWSTSTVGAGAGFVLDPVRHNKPFNAQAVDQCAGCHNYKSGETVATRTWTTGGGTKPISKRVHAVHRGAALNYPTLTVDHEESVVGRDWQINYPMDIRNCESCHSAATSGSWKTNPNRIACMGCHDSDQATAHMKAQVSDPTPTAPWSGDEKESCAACH